MHAASAEFNRNKYRSSWARRAARLIKALDLAHWSFSFLERKQYLGESQPLIVVNSFMVREHFQRFCEVPFDRVHVVRSAIDPNRFPEHDRLKRRQEWRERWELKPNETVGLLAAMN